MTMNNFKKVSRFDAIHEIRSCIEVIDNKGQRITIGVCPACFNNKNRRIQIIEKLKEKGYKVASKEDDIDGRYYASSKHSPNCPFKNNL